MRPLKMRSFRNYAILATVALWAVFVAAGCEWNGRNGEAGAASDPPPPAITKCFVSPNNGAVDVSVAKNITASFSAPMPKGLFILTRSDHSNVNGKVTNDVDAKMITFSPDAPFAPNTTYSAAITNEGKVLHTSCAWSFTTAPVVLIELDDAHFAHDSSSLTPQGQAIMNQNIQTLKDNPILRFLIAGYASASGADEYNQKLSERRATAVRQYLINDGGIAPDRLKKIGYGEDRPAEYEPFPEDIESRAAQANRRVLFTIILDKGGE